MNRTMRQWPRLHPIRQKRVDTLRRIGMCVLAGCIGLAMIVYRYGVANRDPTIEELMPGTAAVIERQRGILYGRAGAAIMGWFDVLQQPIGHAALIVLAGFIGAATLYQVAHAIEIEEG